MHPFADAAMRNPYPQTFPNPNFPPQTEGPECQPAKLLPEVSRAMIELRDRVDESEKFLSELASRLEQVLLPPAPTQACGSNETVKVSVLASAIGDQALRVARLNMVMRDIIERLAI